MYKLLSYNAAGGAVRAGIAVGDVVYDLAKGLGRDSYSQMQLVLEDWEGAKPLLEAFSGKPDASAKVGGLNEITLSTPLAAPGALYCAAANYRDHMNAMAKKLGIQPEPDPHDLDVKPYHFLKPVRAAIAGPAQDVPWPRHADNLDWEVELVAVIGREAREVSVDNALDFVAGYSVANDISVRDRNYMFRPHVSPNSPFNTDFLGMKGFEGSCPIGPWIVPASDIPDPQNLALKTWVDGELKQDSHTSQMVFSTAEQISYLSHLTALFPGDMVLTGTPAGTGAEFDTFLKPGQTMKVWVENIGEFSNRIG